MRSQASLCQPRACSAGLRCPPALCPHGPRGTGTDDGGPTSRTEGIRCLRSWSPGGGPVPSSRPALYTVYLLCQETCAVTAPCIGGGEGGGEEAQHSGYKGAIQDSILSPGSKAEEEPPRHRAACCALPSCWSPSETSPRLDPTRVPHDVWQGCLPSPWPDIATSLKAPGFLFQRPRPLVPSSALSKMSGCSF